LYSGWPSGQGLNFSNAFLQLVVERSKAGFPAVISQTDTLDDDVDANVLMKRILKEACSAGKEQCSEQKVRIESPSGHTIVRDFLKQKMGIAQ